MKTDYRVRNGRLQIIDADKGAVLDERRFGEAPVYKALPLPHGRGCFVLLDPGGARAPTFENLLLVDSSGGLVWKARLPRSHDAFVDVLVTSNGIEGRTWLGLRVTIDLESGDTQEIGFSK